MMQNGVGIRHFLLLSAVDWQMGTVACRAMRWRGGRRWWPGGRVDWGCDLAYACGDEQSISLEYSKNQARIRTIK
jgi:hypothetical protein